MVIIPTSFLGQPAVPLSPPINASGIDTDSGNGQVSGYNDPSDWADDGNGLNDRPGWHHVALSLDQETGVAKFYYDYELVQTRTLVDDNNSGYLHPSDPIEFGKFGSDYGMLIDEIRYSSRTLEPENFLQVVENGAEVWTTYEVDLGKGRVAERTVLLNQLNSSSATSFVPALRVRDESYSSGGKAFTIDSFWVDYTQGGSQAQLIGGASTWKYHVGTAEPSGGVYEPATLGEERAEFVDWIELENTTASSVDLTGWSRTDDSGDPRKWTFPAGTTIPANDHFLILADDLDSVGLSPAFLHSNVKLSRSGEYLALIDVADLAQSEFPTGFPRQFDFQSYGLQPGGSDYEYHPSSGHALHRRCRAHLL
jgi:hypothetical protein